MPAHRLTRVTQPVNDSAIGEALAGQPLAAVADRHHLNVAELAEAVEIYRAAGRHALLQQTSTTWHQVYVQFINWGAAEFAASEHLAPILRRAEAEGRLAAWWFMRKHPYWRLRLKPGPAGGDLPADFATELHSLTQAKQIAAWHTGIYEAETAAFGGFSDVAHDLFTADSSAIIDLLRPPGIPLGRRELSALLISTLFRSARLEWYEQGDVWSRVCAERPLPDDVPQDKITHMGNGLRQLLRTDTSADGPLFGAAGSLQAAADWVDAFRTAGLALGTAARSGTLQRGLREVMSYLVIFHWNRLGLPARTQSILAGAAKSAILGPPPSPAEPQS
ncbi:hypothetical protein GCM10009839_58520 [Catenulispora yoronensis]|uniref:Thiopeptide-type bacteriocin biosynthesis domain-containing protein n=1 Tax=Catenulispora yoronensis TaxID=450799 RepID=A0ABN2V0F8_9ACTN